MKILLTGGTGLIGRHLCQMLLARGHELTVLSRHPNTVAKKCGVDVKSMASLSDYHADMVFDAIINLAGEPIVDKPWTEAQKQQLWQSRIDLTERLVQCIAKAKQKPSVLLSGSAIGFYGDGGDKILLEDSIAANDFGAQLCSAWETAANTATQFGVRVCLLRTGLVLDKVGGFLAKLLLPFKLGLGSRLASGQQWMSWIHYADYVDMVLLLLQTSEATGAYNMTAPQPVTNSQFTKTLAGLLKRPTLLVMPAWLLTLLLGERALLLIGGQRALPNKIQALGYHFRYTTLEQALSDLL